MCIPPWWNLAKRGEGSVLNAEAERLEGSYPEWQYLQSTVKGLWTKFKSTDTQQQKEPPVKSGSFCWQG